MWLERKVLHSVGVFENISSLAQIGFNTLHCKNLYLYILTFAQVFVWKKWRREVCTTNHFRCCGNHLMIFNLLINILTSYFIFCIPDSKIIIFFQIKTLHDYNDHVDAPKLQVDYHIEADNCTELMCVHLHGSIYIVQYIWLERCVKSVAYHLNKRQSSLSHLMGDNSFITIVYFTHM